MRAQLAFAMLLLTSCATDIHTTGRYAARLSANDVQQITRLAETRRIGRTVITLDAVSPDRVHVDERRYNGEGWRSSGFFVIRRGGTWETDEHSEFTAERQFMVY